MRVFFIFSMKNFHTLRPSLAKAISKVEDPELFISIVDLGLLYNITLDTDDTVRISLTLTTIGCPLFDTIEKKVREEVKNILPAKTNFIIDILFDPPWSLDMVSPSAKAELGII